MHPMKSIRTPLKLIAILMFTYTHSAHALMCPSNFNAIDEGNTTEEVEKQCGKPTKTNEYEKEPNVPQEWVYFITPPPTLDAAQQGAVRTTMAFDEQGKLINITVNGFSMQNTSMCGGQFIQLKDDAESIKKSCGAPTLVSKQETNVKTGEAPDKIKVEEWSYSDPFNTILIFENGRFTKSKE